jgi:MacB-like periplasmic core domain/FtsX-like permease family
VRHLSFALAASAAAAVAITLVGAPMLHIETIWPAHVKSATEVHLPTGETAWDAPWDAVAAPPTTPVANALGDLTSTLAWLTAIGLLLCSFTLLLQALASFLSRWNGMIIRAALGARWRHLFGMLWRNWMTAGVVGIVTGLALGVLMVLSTHRVWPSVLGPRSPTLILTVVGFSIATALLFGVTSIAVIAPMSIAYRRQFTSLTGGRVTAPRPLLTLQRMLAALGYAGLLIIGYAAYVVWQDSPRTSTDVVSPESAALHITTMHATSSAMDTSTRSAVFETLWKRQRAGNADSFALTSSGALLGLGPVVPVMAFCGSCFRGSFFTPVNQADVRVVAMSPGWLAVLGAVIEGRDLSEADDIQGPPIVLLNEAAATRLFPGADSVGRTIHIGGTFEGGHTVAGVVHQVPPDGPGNTRTFGHPTIFVSLFQHPPPDIDLVTTGSLDVGNVLSQLGNVLDALIVTPTRPFVDDLDRFRAPSLLFASRLLIVALLATTVACVALSTVMSQVVLACRREIAVRMAIGARATHLFWWVVKRSARIVCVGAFLGVSGARLIWDVLYPDRTAEGVLDPLFIMATAFAVLAVAASVWPAYRAMRLQPAELWSSARP